MSNWVARVMLVLALSAAGGAGGWKLAERFPVRYQGMVRVSVPYETTRGVDAGSLPMQETPARTTLEPSAEWLSAVVERLKTIPSAVQPEGPFETDLDFVRRMLTVRIERQAGQDDYVIEHRSPTVENTRSVLGVAGEVCLESFRRLHDRRIDERTGPLRQEIAEWQAKAGAFEASATKTREEIAAMAPDASGRESARERAKLLTVATAEARKTRLEAENRFAGARDDMTAGKPIETVLARLPEGPLRATLSKNLDQRDRSTERRELQRELGALSELYGAKHPRIVRVRERIAELTEPDPASGSSATRPVELLLATLEADWREKLALEQDLSEQLSADEGSLQGFDAAQARLAEAERGLGEARAKIGSITARRESEAARFADEAPRISEGPLVADTPVTWTVREWMLTGAAVGAIGGLVVAFFTRRAARVDAVEEAPPSTPLAREGAVSTLLAARRLERLGRLRQMQSGNAWSQPAPSRM
jgi:hypothetical protein